MVPLVGLHLHLGGLNGFHSVDSCSLKGGRRKEGAIAGAGLNEIADWSSTNVTAARDHRGATGTGTGSMDGKRLEFIAERARVGHELAHAGTGGRSRAFGGGGVVEAGSFAAIGNTTTARGLGRPKVAATTGGTTAGTESTAGRSVGGQSLEFIAESEGKGTESMGGRSVDELTSVGGESEICNIGW